MRERGSGVNDRSTDRRPEAGVAGVEAEAPRRIGRYALHGVIGAGGMATVHLGRLFGPRGFARIVAIKRLHAVYAEDPEFTARFMREARLASRIRHPNVVPVLDVLAEGGELSLVLEYVEGESLARLLRIARERRQAVPVAIAAAIACGVLHGLHAAHQSEGENGERLGVVHRDVSPHNVIVGVDGVARVLDFGVAKAIGLAPATRGTGAMGKLAYMAPEQVRREAVSAAADVYAASVVLWETLCGRRLFQGEDESDVAEQVLIGRVDPPSKVVPAIEDAIEAIVLRGLASDAQKRPDARAMALALEPFAALGSTVAAWMVDLASARLAERATLVRDAERAAPAIDEGEATPHGAAASPGPVVPSAPSRSPRSRPLLVAGALGILATLVALGALASRSSATARGARPAESPTSAPAAEARPGSSERAGGPGAPSGEPPREAEPGRAAASAPSTPSSPSAPSAAPAAITRARPEPARAARAATVTDAAPPASARRCESVDPVTGDIHFDRSCR